SRPQSSLGRCEGCPVQPWSAPPKSCEVMQFCFRLLQPEPHVHLAVHGRRGGEILARLLSLAGACEELTEAEMAVGDERTHPQFFGDGDRVVVVALSVLRGIVAGRDLAEELEGPRFVGALTALAGKSQRSPYGRARVLEAAGEGIRFTQMHQ